MPITIDLPKTIELGGLKWSQITIPDEVTVEQAVKIGQAESTEVGRIMELVQAACDVPRDVIFKQPARFIDTLSNHPEAAALIRKHVAECTGGNPEEAGGD